MLLGLCLIMALGCAPTVTVNNNTAFPIRVMVRSGGSINGFPRPLQALLSRSVKDCFCHTIPDAEWTACATAKRRYLQ